MKLHLPKLLRVAVIAAAAGISTGYAATLTSNDVQYPKDDQSTSDKKEGASYLVVGQYGSFVNSTDKWSGDLVVGQYVNDDGEQVRGDADYVGIFDSNWNFVPVATKITKDFIVDGDVTINGSSRILLGGKPSSSTYTGLTAKNVTLNGNGSTVNLESMRFSAETLVLNNARAYLHMGQRPGNGYFNAGVKQAVIKNGITVNGSGSYLLIGSQGGASTNYDSATNKITYHYVTSLGTSSNALTLTQNAGSVELNGDIAAKSGLQINQTGGKMTLRDYLSFVGGDLSTITQDGQNGATPTMSIGRLGTEQNNSLTETHVKIHQKGSGTINLVYGSEFGKKGTIHLVQDGTGNIVLGNGGAASSYHSFLTGFACKNSSYQIEQNSGKITLKPSAVVKVDSASISGEVIVEAGATLGAAYGKNLAWNDTEWKSQDGISAPIVVKETGALDMASGSKYGVSFTTDFLAGLTQETTSAVLNETDKLNKKSEFDFTVSAIQNADQTKLADGFALIDMDSRLWSLKDGAQWVSNGNSSYVDGTLVYDYWIDVTDVVGDAKSTTCTEVFADVSDYLQVGIKVSGESVTLKGANKHTYGTILDGSTSSTGLTVTLGTANALGKGAVTTTGATTLKGSSKTTYYNLPSAIQNSGNLTLSCLLNVSTLETAPMPDFYVDAEGNISESGNGFRHYGCFEVQVVNNGDGASLTVAEGYDKIKHGSLIGKLETTETGAYTGVASFVGGIDYATYVSNDKGAALKVSELQDISKDQLTTVVMTKGSLTADGSVIVNLDGSSLVLSGDSTEVSGELKDTDVDAQGGTISADIIGTSDVTVTGDTTLSGSNTYTGGTVIQGATLKLAANTGVGTGDVLLTSTADGCGVFDMGGNALDNKLVVTGCILRNAHNYKGAMEVSHKLEVEGEATAKKVTLIGEGTLVRKSTLARDAKSGGSMSIDELDVKTDGDATLDIDLTINDNGTVRLNDGKVLSVKGSLTLGKGVKLVLTDDDYGVGDTLLSSTGTLTMGDVTLVYNDSTMELECIGNSIVLVSKFKQRQADAAAQTNWGIATASRAFVNTVRGQRSNTGCIADGRGTVWVSALGAYNDLDGSDIDVKGAAVGVDARIGADSTVGIAFGYTEGEVSPSGLTDADQEGEYVALYGEHGLKKLGSTSSLSLDWVAAYGRTDSEWQNLKWEQDSLQLNTRLNWNKKLTGRLSMNAFGGLEYFATESDTSRGVKSGSIQNLRGEVGVGVRYVAWGTPASEVVSDAKGGTIAIARPGCEKLVLNGELRYINDMVRSNPVIEMDGLRGSGENPGRQGMGIEAGATYRISDRWSASANYSYNAMEDSREHRANVGASYTF